jgi:hypothetical protein
MGGRDRLSEINGGLAIWRIWGGIEASKMEAGVDMGGFW